jgi:hypothetical protein
MLPLFLLQWSHPVTTEKTKIIATRILAYLVAFHALLAYGLPGGMLALLAIGIGILYARIQVVGTVATSLSLVVSTLLYGLVLKVSGFGDAIYYRPDEILTEYRRDLGHRAYRAGETIRMLMPHGDLQPMTNARIGVAHDVEYRIDRYGFRNDADYAGEPYIFVGDSFIAGSSNTQSDLLSVQLKQDYELPGYNLAHPGGLPDYADYVEAFARNYHDFRVLVFVFEGNDFEVEKDHRQSTPSRLLKNYLGIFSNTNVYRVTKSLIKRAMLRSQLSGQKYVTLGEIREQRIALLTRYIEATKAKELQDNEQFERALARLKHYQPHIFFIPTNYRIYYRELEGAQATALPDANWEYLRGLCARERIECTNLTAPMIRASEAFLAKGELLWWPDDTHWNRNGIGVAARVVAETLKHGNPVPKATQKK